MRTVVQILPKKYAYQQLKKIYGLNNHTIKKFIGILELKPRTLGIDLNDKYLIRRINELLFVLKVEFRLKLIVFSRIILLIYNKTYKGMRHMQGLPCRGQRTHSNGKTPKFLKLNGKNLPFKIKYKKRLEYSKLKQSIKKKIYKKKKNKIVQKTKR